VPILTRISTLTEKRGKLIRDLTEIRARIVELQQACATTTDQKAAISKSLEGVKEENINLGDSNTLLMSEIEEMESTSLLRQQALEKERQRVSDLEGILFKKKESLEVVQKESGEVEAEFHTVQSNNEARAQSMLSSFMEGEIEKRFDP
jgi:chromosome segregation ATPase